MSYRLVSPTVVTRTNLPKTYLQVDTFRNELFYVTGPWSHASSISRERRPHLLRIIFLCQTPSLKLTRARSTVTSGGRESFSQLACRLLAHTTYGSCEGFQEGTFCRPQTARNGTLRNSLLQPPHVCSKTNISRRIANCYTHEEVARRFLYHFCFWYVSGDTSFVIK